MAIFASNLAPASTDRALGGSVIERCVRFRQTSQDANSPNFERTYPSAGNRKVYTYSFWIKRHHLNFETVFKSYYASSDRAQIDLQSDGRIRYWQVDYTGSTYYVQPNRLLRDTNAWYHIVIAVDTTQATAANRVKFYINGNLETDFNTSDYPPQNDSTYFNNNWKHNIGVHDGGNDFYIAEVHFVDGYQKEASDFGYTESQTGIWRPKKYTGTYGGDNGYYLDFSDGTSLTTLGLDKSGKGNNWTAENFQVSAGYNQDTLFDTPTKEYPTLNFLHHNSRNATFKNGNLYATIPAADTNGRAFGNTALTSGKWYYEVLYNQAGGNGDYLYVGLQTPDGQTFRRAVRGSDGEQYPNTGATEVRFTTNDIINVAVDLDAGKWYIGRNGTYWYSGNPVAGTGFVHSDLISANATTPIDGLVPLFYNATSGASQQFSVNFGQRPFSYTPPSGFKEINSLNLPLNVPSTIRPQKHFDTILYTGNGTSGHSISGLEFKPDLVWIKNRDGTYYHNLADTVRGITRSVNSNANDAEVNYSNVSAVHDHGFVVGASELVNKNSQNLVAWCWKAGGAAVANSDGNTASQVSVNTEAGFSIVTYTGTGSSTTIGHGLGKKPEMIFMKSRSATGDWAVLDKANTTAEYTFYLNDNNAYGSSSGYTFYADTPPTSSVWTVNSASATNASGVTYVAYCWTSIPGYSKIGSYEGNSNANGTYVYLGFRPAWVLFKRNDYGGNWFIVDNKRDVDNECTRDLYPNTTGTETNNSNFVDFLSDGFKLRTTGSAVNTNTIVYMAFAEQQGQTPFNTFTNAR
tara:strand:- start:34 stop:2439 length:2406 start_codon:yes stop_codon:yes gene_type:complete